MIATIEGISRNHSTITAKNIVDQIFNGRNAASGFGLNNCDEVNHSFIFIVLCKTKLIKDAYR